MTQEEFYEDIGVLVAAEASEIFEACGEPDDFCIQSVGMQAVFGGFNRLIWNPKAGFFPDRSYCRDKFLAEFDRIYGQKGE